MRKTGSSRGVRNGRLFAAQKQIADSGNPPRGNATLKAFAHTLASGIRSIPIPKPDGIITRFGS